MLHSGRRPNQKQRVLSAQTRSVSASRLSVLERPELEEKFAKALDQNKELKTRNNELQEALKQLKARLRWPPHIQEAVLGKESQQQEQNLKVLESRNLQLAEQCQLYERTIRQLEGRLEVNKAFAEETSRSYKMQDEHFDPQMLTSKNRCAEKPSHGAQFEAVKKAMEEWKSHAIAYKQQAAEAVSRLKDTEERLAQMLRLHTLDSAELIRTSRTSKHAVAQLTSVQEENRQMKAAIEKFQEKIDEMVGQLEAEKLRNIELQENVSQVQQLRRANIELLQEIDDVKKEKSAIQGQLQNLVHEAAQIPEALETETKHLRKQIDALRKEHAGDIKKLHQVLEDKGQQVKDLEAQAEELKSQLSNLKSQQEVKPKKIHMDHKNTQTISLEIDLKPPEATVELSNEESDQMLSQMNDEVEMHKQTMRSLQSMCESYKKELESLHEQLQTERKNYARQLSLEMAQFKALQEQLKNCSNNQIVVQAEIEAPKKAPKPKPRKIIRQVKAASENEEIKELVLEIESLLVPEKSLLLGMKDNFFIDFKITLPSGEESESYETPANYPLPTSPSSPAHIGHKHKWQEQKIKALFRQPDCIIQFDLVSDNDKNPDMDCTEIGIGKLPLTELLRVAEANNTVNLDVPISIEGNSTAVASLKVALTKVS
ncbi:myosin heavy chain, clone 203-like isoform X2 [Cloeon dipterum]|uniref:myosin heavy chain, clone 203-like isoform X2 n=1 Tax=Cloeon dipterum TaxID=197152 RepID=UPI00321F6A4A